MLFPRSLGSRLALQFCLVAAVPLAAVAALVWILLLPQIRVDLGTRDRAQAGAVASQVATQLAGAKRQLIAVANFLDTEWETPEAIQIDLLDVHAGRGKIFEAIYLVDGTDTIQSVGLPSTKRHRRPNLVGLDLSRRPFLQEARDGQAIVWSETFLSTVTSRLAIALAIPIDDQVLVGEITLHRLSQFISADPSDTENLTIILDNLGRVIGDSRQQLEGQHLDMQRLPLPHFGKGLESQEFELQGQLFLGTAVDIEPVGWTVIVAQPKSQAFHTITTTLGMVGAGLSVALLMAVSAGLLLARKFSRQFQRYTTMAGTIARGDYSHPWPASDTREFSDLGENLLQMSRAIQKREQDLAASEARYRSVVSNAPVVMIQFDRQGTISLYEGKTLTGLGLREPVSVGRSVFDLFANFPDVQQQILLATRGQSVNFPARLGERDYDLHFSPVPDEKGSFFILGLGIDVTERTRMEKALQDQAQLLKEAQKVARLGHFTLDVASGRWHSSEVLDEIYGIGPDYCRDFNGWLQLIHPDHREDIERYISESVLKNRGSFDREFKIIRHSGREERWVHGRGYFAEGSAGQERIIGTTQDITAQKQLEEQLVQAQKMEAVGRLAGGVAHDFNNMLSVILGYAELLHRRLPQNSPLLKNVTEIEKAAGHSREITRQLLAFSRKQIIEPKSVDLNGLIQGIRNTLARLVGEDVKLELGLESKLWRVKIDPTQVEQVLINLAANARDAMATGGRLNIETENLFLDRSYSHQHPAVQPGEYVRVAMSDNGRGMNEETVSHIFEPFYTTKSFGEGTGLGLATVYGIIQQHGGFIYVYSEPGAGTTFKIYLPRCREQVENLPLAVAEEASSPGSGTILLVEDENMVREIAENMLQELGYTVVTAETPEAALQLCQTRADSIDLLMTDVVMPGMSGAELRDKITTLRPALRTLFMSGYTSNVITHHGVLDKGVNFLQKPFTLTALAEKIQQILQTD